MGFLVAALGLTHGNAAAEQRDDASTPIEVTVRGQSEAERLRHSSEAVHIVETEAPRRRTADLGEVLARTQGVGVQRSGGLGSETRFSLNGLTDDQIRFFLDGVPLELSAYRFGIANVPVDLVERVEIYRGVVPVRFGADALGGAVNLVSDRDIHGTHGSLSFQGGSFGTYRSTLSARHLDERSGWLARVSAFADRADNDYPMDINVPDARGREMPARVHRFHDAYAAHQARRQCVRSRLEATVRRRGHGGPRSRHSALPRRRHGSPKPRPMKSWAAKP